MSKVSMTKAERNAHIQDYADMIFSNPGFYMDTESYCDTDIYEYAAQLAYDEESSEYALCKSGGSYKTLSPKEQERKMILERLERGKLKEAPNEVCLMLTDKEFNKVVKSLEEDDADEYGFKFVRDSILEVYPQLRLDHFDHIEFDECNSDNEFENYESGEILYEARFYIYYTDWYEADMKLENELDEKRNNRKKTQKQYIPPKLRYKIFKRDNFRCRICGRSVEDGVKLHVDHKYPESKGGTLDEDNLQTLCEECNLGKSDDI